MAIIFDEHKYVETNIMNFEERMGSKYSRFTGNAQTYSTYFHINDEKTSLDEGLDDIEELIGSRSPLRFDKINGFPLYGLEPIVLQIVEGEQGYDTSYEGEVIVLPGTIIPCENDMFIINHVKNGFIFRVTAVDYDTLKTNNYYKLSFSLEAIDEDKVGQLLKQVVTNCECILENVGTDKKCIIEEAAYHLVNDIQNMYDDMVNTYMTLYYDETYNSLIGELRNGRRIYDPLQAEFINKHNLFNKSNDFNTIILSEQFTDRERKIKYEKSLYRFIERNNVDLLNNFYYTIFLGCTNPETTFYKWHDKSIYILDIPRIMDKNNSDFIISDKFIEDIRINNKMQNNYAQLIKKYIKKEIKSINDIDLTLNDALLHLDDCEELFFFTPIILYIIKTTLDSFLQKEQ